MENQGQNPEGSRGTVLFSFCGGSNRAPFPVFLMMRIREKRTVTQNKEGIAGKEGAPENVAPQKLENVYYFPAFAVKQEIIFPI